MMNNGRLRLDHIRKLHPNLSMWEALDLLEFARKKTITHVECYGNGEIIYPMWLSKSND
jgi:hypothetical protein